MAKTKTLNDVKNIMMRLIPNHERMSSATHQPEYVQWALKMSGFATDNAGTDEPGVEMTEFGTWRDTPYTAKELYTYIKNAGTMNNAVAAAMKTFYLNMINEDIST